MNRSIMSRVSPVFAMDEDAARPFLARLYSADAPPSASLAVSTRERPGQLYVRDGVAVVPVVGPTLWHEDWWTEYFEIRTYEAIARELDQIEGDRSIHSVVGYFDTPGGEAAGVHELAERFHALREKKRTAAYVAGGATSAGYWNASAMESVTTDALGVLGSVGVIGTYFDASKWLEKVGVQEIVIVSEQSPHKFTDPATQEGYDRIKATLSSMADVFGAAVARNRDTTKERVFAEFGRGWVKIGQEAVDAGLADRLGSFESVLADVSAAGRKRVGYTGAQSGGQRMEITRAYLDEHEPVLVKQILAEGKASAGPDIEQAEAAERARITGVLEVGFEAGQPRASVRGFEGLVLEAAATPGVTKAELALQIMDARDKKEAAAKADRLAAIEAGAQSQHPGPGALADVNDTPDRVQAAVANARRAGVLRKQK
jgi:ClpP class serine protease